MGLFDSLFGKKVADQITPEADQRYNEFLNQALAALNAQNQIAAEKFGFGTFDEWSLNQEEGILKFLDEGGTVRIETPVVILGTYSSQSATWMWGWANQSLVPDRTAPTTAIRDYGQTNGISDFTQPKIECDESEAWAMAAASWKLLGGSGVYRGPTGAGYAFLLMKEIKSYPAA